MRQLTDQEYDRCIKERLCFCGSMQPKDAEYDARGIFLTYVCDECRAEKLGHYRPDVLTDSQYEADEDIEPDYYDDDPAADRGDWQCHKERDQ